MRVSPALFVFLEKSDPLLNLIYKIRVAGKPLFKFSIALVYTI